MSAPPPYDHLYHVPPGGNDVHHCNSPPSKPLPSGGGVVGHHKACGIDVNSPVFSDIAPVGLRYECVKMASAYRKRLWIIDNSGSMGTMDGNKLITRGQKRQFVKASRWDELHDTVIEQAKLAFYLGAAIEFRPLNALEMDRQLKVEHESDLLQVEKMMARPPSGRTPLCLRIRECIHQLCIDTNTLGSGERLLLVICSDGEASDGDAATALLPLADMPVDVIVKICSDEEHIVEYWNNIDAQVENVSIDIIDDLEAEAKEVHKVNSWLTYHKGLHQARLFGQTNRLFDLIDERALVPNEKRSLSMLLLGPIADELPYTEEKSYTSALENLVKQTSMVWSVVKREMRPLIDVKKMKKSGWFFS